MPEVDESLSEIDEHRIVSLHFRLGNGLGETIDSSEGGPPLVYMHNTNALLPALERELTGHRAGDAFEVTIFPEDAYGYADESLVQSFPRAALAGLERRSGPGSGAGPGGDPAGEDRSGGDRPGGDPFVVGARVRALGKDGESRLATVREVDDDDVVLDANHPLAGQVLHFSIAIVAVREPTAAELAAGGVGGRD